MQWLLNIVWASIGTVGILAFLGWLFRNWIDTKLKARIHHAYDVKLAELKAENDRTLLTAKSVVDREAALIASVRAAFSEGQKASVERRLSAVERIWARVVQLRTGQPPIVPMLDIMTVEEHQGIKGNAQLSQLAASLNQDSVMKQFRQEGEALENVRLYTGEYLWSLCFCYEAIVLRALLSLMFSHDDSTKLEWYKDAGTLGLISAVLSPEELQEFSGTAFGKLGWIQWRLEWKILSASQKVISGEQFGVEVLERAKVIQERAAELTRS